jgi:hypothetical protein
MIKESLLLLGKKAKDKVTGFEGIVTSISFDLYGCITGLISPGLDKEGKVAQSTWFDTNRLDVSEEPPVMKVPDFTIDKGAETNKPTTF